jgi:hypothetical protein
MSGFKFGDLVYHKGKKCVYMGVVDGINKNTVEVLFEGKVLTSTVSPEELTNELEPIKYVDDDGDTYSFQIKDGLVDITRGDEDSLLIYSDDVDRFIDCMMLVKSRITKADQDQQ